MKIKLLSALALIGLSVLLWRSFAHPAVAQAQTRKPLFITRIYTGADGLSHAEEVEMKFSGSPTNQVSEMMKATGAEFHRAAPGNASDWHAAPRRQYVITLSGQGEIEVAGGKKIPIGPGHVDLIEDLTGKGHITRTVGTEDRLIVQIPLDGPVSK